MLLFDKWCLFMPGPLVPWDRLCTWVTGESLFALSGLRESWALQQVQAWLIGEVLLKQSNPVSQRILSLIFLCLEKAVEQNKPFVHMYHTTNPPAWQWMDTHSTQRGQERFPEVNPGPAERQTPPLWDTGGTDHLLWLFWVDYWKHEWARAHCNAIAHLFSGVELKKPIFKWQ